MAYEELPMPEYHLPAGVGVNDPNEAIDFIMVADVIDTAFTDFSTHVKFTTEYAGQHWSDSEAEFACLKRAMDNGIPILDGKFLAKITRQQLNEIFSGNIEMPMLDEKLAVLHQVGPVLAEKYKGRFSNFIHSCPPRLYDNGKGIIERLVVEFPRFNDVSQYDGYEIKLYKLPQLGIWFVYSSLHPAGKIPVGRYRRDDRFRGLHRARCAAPAGDHQLFARARARDQYVSDDSARQHAGSGNPRALHLRHGAASRGSE